MRDPDAVGGREEHVVLSAVVPPPGLEIPPRLGPPADRENVPPLPIGDVHGLMAGHIGRVVQPLVGDPWPSAITGRYSATG